jgi:hypothetical protein
MEKRERRSRKAFKLLKFRWIRFNRHQRRLGHGLRLGDLDGARPLEQLCEGVAAECLQAKSSLHRQDGHGMLVQQLGSTVTYLDLHARGVGPGEHFHQVIL